MAEVAAFRAEANFLIFQVGFWYNSLQREFFRVNSAPPTKGISYGAGVIARRHTIFRADPLPFMSFEVLKVY
jgi:hypothetical protein